MVNLDYLKNLNKAQTEAVTHIEGPLLVVAGAGSGKTKVLTSRIAHIISKKKAYPNQIREWVNGEYKITEEDNKVHQKYRTDMVEVTWR